MIPNRLRLPFLRSGRKRLGILLLCLAVNTVWAQGLSDVQQQLTNDIQAAQAALSQAEAQLSQERGELATTINGLQNQVYQLREEAVAARRLADEQTLSLSRIEQRLATWEEQSQFQNRLLAGYLDRHQLSSLQDSLDAGLDERLDVFLDHLAETERKLNPLWQPGRVILPGGQIAEARTLSLGPVHFFHLPESSRAGIYDAGGEIDSVTIFFDEADTLALNEVYSTGEGEVTFDPTLSRALLLVEDNETILEHLQKGGIWVLPILFFALFASVIAIFKAVALLRLPVLVPALPERIQQASREGGKALYSLTRGVKGYQAELLQITLAGSNAQQRDDRLYAKLLEQKNRLEKWLGAIAVIASVSPLLGLLGTVSGMIATFKLMTLFGAGDASAVSSGISEALVTTELGLIVAIPALLAHALMSRKVRSYFAQLEDDAIHFSQINTSGVA